MPAPPWISVVATAAVELVEAVAAEDLVGGVRVGGLRRSVDAVVAGPAVEQVGRVVADQLVGAEAARDTLDVGVDRVVLAGLPVVRGRSVEVHLDALLVIGVVGPVGSEPAVHRVGVEPAAQHVVAGAAGERVDAVATVDRQVQVRACAGRRVVAVAQFDLGLGDA